MADNQMWSMILKAIFSLFQEKMSEKSAPAPTPAPLPDVSVHMNSITLKLQRTAHEEAGVFGILTDESGNHIAATLEHSYGLTSKIPNGTFQCVRSAHRLHNMTEDFITFEIEGIQGHDNILFHWGNYEKDSEGCVLLGDKRVGDMVTNSKVTFKKFMDLLEGQDSFVLEVS